MRVLIVAKKIPHYESISPFTLDQVKSIRNLGVDVELFMTEGGGYTSYLRNIIKLRKHLRHHQYDIVHSHYGLQGLISILADKRQNHILSFMGSDLNILNEKKLRLKILFNKVLTKFLLFKLNHFKGIIVKSNKLFEIIRSKHPQIEIIPNGVDLSKFKEFDKSTCQTKVGYNKKKIHVGFVSAYDNNPNKNINLAKKAVEKAGLEYDIELTRIFGLKHDQLVYYYNAIDLLLFTSLNEGSPNVIKEAMACNCPIVSVDVGDVPERLEGVKNSYISKYDPNLLAKYIGDIIQQKERSNGREIVMTISLENIAERIVKLYNKCQSK